MKYFSRHLQKSTLNPNLKGFKTNEDGFLIGETPDRRFLSINLHKCERETGNRRERNEETTTAAPNSSGGRRRATPGRGGFGQSVFCWTATTAYPTDLSFSCILAIDESSSRTGPIEKFNFKTCWNYKIITLWHVIYLI